MIQKACEKCHNLVTWVRVDGKGMTTIPVVFGVTIYDRVFTDRGGTSVCSARTTQDIAVNHESVCTSPEWRYCKDDVPEYDKMIDFIGMGNYSLDQGSYVIYHYVGKFKEDAADGNYFETDQARFRVHDDFVKLWRYRVVPQGLL